jgi:divalent metal cation (Fe/Co/Zn/Cd) transporter
MVVARSDEERELLSEDRGARGAASVDSGVSRPDWAPGARDSINVVLLGLSLRRSRQPADVEHPLGYGRARFLWAFLAAISSFLIGGCLSIALAVHDLLHGAAVGRFSVAWVVLGVAALADGSSLVQTLRQARREAAFWGQTTIGYLRHTSDPTLRALAVEDSAALAGIAIAAAGLLVHQLGALPGATRSPRS